MKIPQCFPLLNKQKKKKKKSDFSQGTVKVLLMGSITYFALI